MTLSIEILPCNLLSNAEMCLKNRIADVWCSCPNYLIINSIRLKQELLVQWLDLISAYLMIYYAWMLYSMIPPYEMIET